MFATDIEFNLHWTEHNFQYPVFGSSVCNIEGDYLYACAYDFQYPVFGSSVCNTLSAAEVSALLAFSTLCSGRVFATAEMAEVYCDLLHFQYPVFGSSVCNFYGGKDHRRQQVLSVPCVRVECLQPWPRGRARS